jgi:hypothetical protein
MLDSFLTCKALNIKCIIIVAFRGVHERFEQTVPETGMRATYLRANSNSIRMNPDRSSPLDCRFALNILVTLHTCIGTKVRKHFLA